MKVWAVLIADPILGTIQRVHVEAQYFRVQDGVLAFRDYPRDGGYPEPVRVFAPGYWLEVQRG